MTFLCVMILIVGSLYFAHDKLERDRIRQTNGTLSAAFHSGVAEGETPAPTQTPPDSAESTPSASEESTLLVSVESTPSDNVEELPQTEEPTLEPAIELASSSDDWRDFDPFDLPEVLDVPIGTQQPTGEIQPAFQELLSLIHI